MITPKSLVTLDLEAPRTKIPTTKESRYKTIIRNTKSLFIYSNSLNMKAPGSKGPFI